jgi:hypothetical protein
MKLQTLAAACLAASSLATAAFAAEPVTAKLASPVATPTKFIAGGAVFQCEGDTCYAGATTSQTFAVGTCKDVASKVGALASFEGRHGFDDAHLAQCNAVAAKTTATTLAKTSPTPAVATR